MPNACSSLQETPGRCVRSSSAPGAAATSPLRRCVAGGEFTHCRPSVNLARGAAWPGETGPRAALDWKAQHDAPHAMTEPRSIPPVPAELAARLAELANLDVVAGASVTVARDGEAVG